MCSQYVYNFKHCNETVSSRRNFLIELSESLCKPLMDERNYTGVTFQNLLRQHQNLGTRNNENEELERRVRCRLCTQNKTKTICLICKNFVCGTCSQPLCAKCGSDFN